MSLTSELDDRSSRLRRFFETRFPLTTLVVQEINSEARRRSPLPIGDLALSSHAAGLSGMALDYRIRYALKPFAADDTVAARGLEDLEDFIRSSAPPLAVFELRNLFSHIDKDLESFLSVTCSRRHDPLSARLLEDCILLAQLEEIFRAGTGYGDEFELPIVRSALADDPRPLDQRLRADVPRDVLADLAALYEGFITTQADLLSRRTILNPVFDGSAAVGGADADFVTGRTLIDIKSSRAHSPVDRTCLLQLIGYALLDWSDEYRIEYVGFYLARRMYLWVHGIESLLQRLSGERLSLWDAREALVRALHARSMKEYRGLRVRTRRRTNGASRRRRRRSPARGEAS